MDKIELTQILSQAIGKQRVISLTAIIAQHDFSIKELIDLSFHQTPEIAFRAAWIMESVYISNIEKFLPATTYFLERFAEQGNSSCRRHYCKILALMTQKNAPLPIKSAIAQYPLDALIETVFAWLIDEEVPVAIKSHILNILANLSAQQDWIKDELQQTMDYLVDKESIAFFAKVKQIRKQLKRASL